MIATFISAYHEKSAQRLQFAEPLLDHILNLFHAIFILGCTFIPLYNFVCLVLNHLHQNLPTILLHL